MTTTNGLITVIQVSATPTAPGTGFDRFYAKTDDLPYFQKSDGTEVAITTGVSADPLTTKGDLWGYSTVNTRVPVGSNNTLLIADSSQALGLRWGSNPTLSGATIDSSIIGGSSAAAGAFTTLTGTSVTSTGQVLVTLITEQLRLRYDASNYTSFTVSSAGALTLSSSAAGAITTFSSTGAITLPVGTTAQEPGSPVAGMARYNSTTSRFEFYSSAWKNHVRLDGDTMTGALEIDIATASTNALILKSTDDGATNPIFKVLNSTGATIQSQITADGRLALYGQAFTDSVSLLQTTGASLSITGSATSYTAHRMTPTFIVNTSNETGTLSGTGGGISVNQNGFTVSNATAISSVATATGTTGTVSSLRGLVATIVNSGAGTVSNGFGLIVASSTNTGGGTFTSAVGVAINTQTVGTNNTLLLLGTVSVASGNWGIYSATTNNNLIQGPLSLKNGTTTPTAYLHLGAGTTAASTAPLKFTTGTSMTSAEAGAMEYTTDDLFFTISTSTARKRLLMADAVGGLTSGRVPYATTNGRLTDASTFTFDGTTVTITTLAKPTTFNGDTLAGNALVTNIGRIHLTGQTAAISITSIVTPAADGEYVISLVLTDTTAGISGTITATITWTDYNGVQTFTSSALTVASTGFVDFIKSIHARTTGAIRYQVDLTSVVGSPQFAIDINVIRVS